MYKEIKEQSSEYFDYRTVGKIVEILVKRHGYQAKVNQQFTKKPLPYMIRTDQSTHDFLTRLADRVQVRFLIKDNEFLFLSDYSLPALAIHK
ncbi:hypothetical protein ME9_00925 [Bartonella taylorii 8TBB]|uniref:Uncharacterized protein n=1 Tax=Bartonella taylorii 8TBB TaxID=1094560 RepID=A0A9P2W2Z1_BARTA|nr:hypothetical protein ME9_00925 [Bartonella taylorii 8TBB]